MEKKSNVWLYIIIVILCVALTVAVCYILFKKDGGPIVKQDEPKQSNVNNIEPKTYKSYNIGDKVNVSLNNNEIATFYVLKQSSEYEEYVTLFAEKNIGTSAFDTNEKNNEYKGSLIENKLNELTNSWSNIKEKRLITIEEMEATGYVYKNVENRDIEGYYPSEISYIKGDSFLLHKDSNGGYEEYWTMTKVDKNKENLDINDGRNYVYKVETLGSIGVQNVNATAANTSNYTYLGIRPVIVVSKSFVKQIA